jgi:outer membrane biosynthesis protein TonB
MVAFPRSRLVQKTLFDLPTPARVEPEPLPEVIPEPEPLPEVIPEQEPTPEVIPEQEPTPEVIPEQEPTPEVIPEQEPTPEVIPEPEVQGLTSFTCGCGSVISLTNKTHVKTQKHLLWELSQVELNGQNDELVRQGGLGEDEVRQEL